MYQSSLLLSVVLCMYFALKFWFIDSVIMAVLPAPVKSSEFVLWITGGTSAELDSNHILTRNVLVLIKCGRVLWWSLLGLGFIDLYYFLEIHIADFLMILLREMEEAIFLSLAKRTIISYGFILYVHLLCNLVSVPFCLLIFMFQIWSDLLVYWTILSWWVFLSCSFQSITSPGSVLMVNNTFIFLCILCPRSSLS